MRTRITSLAFGVVAGLLAGCTGIPGAEEIRARARVSQIDAALRLSSAERDLPALRADSPSSDYLRFALLKHPGVAAAFHDWRASVEAITPARSLPDPQLTFEADIADMVMTFMPGLMFDFMTPGKQAAMGREAAAASEVAYRTYATTVLRTAAAV
ncbi:MAG TPA: TolC family protein, partial [Opitutaceae bacterium]